MRLVFIAPEEPLILPLFFERAVPALRDDEVAIAVVSPIYKNSTWLKQSIRFVRSFGLRWFVIEVTRYAWNKSLDALSRLVPMPRAYSVRSVARQNGVPLLRPHDVNGPEFLATLRSFQPDLVISVACPQIFTPSCSACPGWVASTCTALSCPPTGGCCRRSGPWSTRNGRRA